MLKFSKKLIKIAIFCSLNNLYLVIYLLFSQALVSSFYFFNYFNNKSISSSSTLFQLFFSSFSFFSSLIFFVSISFCFNSPHTSYKIGTRLLKNDLEMSSIAIYLNPICSYTCLFVLLSKNVELQCKVLNSGNSFVYKRKTTKYFPQYYLNFPI